jgi:hypothetical protein
MYQVRLARLIGSGSINAIAIVPQTFPGSIGDAAMISGAINGLRARYPEAKIGVFSTVK